MIDIHCHILPEVDDGPKSWEVSIGMCRMAAEDGITHMIATPHANDHYPYDREYLMSLVEELRRRVGPVPELGLGCDFHFSDENLEKLFARPHRYTIGETNYLLVELSDYSIPPQLADGFRKLGDIGLTPILTHPERNPILQKTPQRVLEIADQGCLVQVTASSLTGFWGERPQMVSRWLLERSAVHILATDAHSTRHRVPILSAGRDVAAEMVGAECAAALVEGNPGAIVKGEPVPYCPRPVLD
ncbi:MAG: CpsB/CapC family capsule biosynthesis tyrosine phosphatase [Terriglobales bacterium]